MTDPAPPASYPADWEADVVLADGGTAHLRPIVPADADALRALHARLSDDTVYKRFFSHHRLLSDAEVARFTRVDHADRVALVATIATDLVAVGRYDRIEGGTDAEVAFVVEDRHQGRGIGSVLLEHLAAAGLERGITRFVADVLPGNQAMLRVFLDAGYAATRTYDEGVVHLEFDIEPTAASVAVAQAREQRAEARSIARLLAPSSVAVVGAGREGGGVGRALLDHLLAAHFAGPVYPVHPAARHVASIRAYPSVLDIPDEVDLAVVATPAATVATVVDECAVKGVRGLVVVSAGFAETGAAADLAAQRELVARARANGMRVIGPNCLGVMNTDPAVSLNATLAPLAPPRGSVGFFCQSGALGIALLESVARRGLGLSTFVSAGNRADVSGNDLLQYWQDDPATEVVLLYLESFGNPRKFGRLARRLARSKPVVAVKTGRSLAGRPAGHASASAALPEETVDALFAQAGVIRVDTLAQMFDVASVLAYQPLPAGRRLAVVGNSAALGVLAADAAASAGLSVVRAVDVGPDGGAAAVADELAAALGADDVDAVVTVFVPPLAALATSGADAVGGAIASAAAGAAKPVVSTFLAFEGVPPALRHDDPSGVAARGSIPSFRSPEAAVHALARACSYAEWRARPAGTLTRPAGVDVEAARAALSPALVAAGDEPSVAADDTVRAVLAAIGVTVVPERRATSAAAAVAAAGELGWPVAVKAADPALRRRPDLGGVWLNVAGARELRAAYDAVRSVGGDAVVVQPMAPPGVATVVSVREDPSFGALVSLGVGGVATDLLGDRAYRAVPLTDRDAHELVRAPRAAPMLSGWGGADPVDVAALADLLLRVGVLADELPEIRTLDLDPVLVGRQGLSVLHAGLVVGPTPARADSGPRRLRPA